MSFKLSTLAPYATFKHWRQQPAVFATLAQTTRGALQVRF